jgi:hypothetical protein
MLWQMEVEQRDAHFVVVWVIPLLIVPRLTRMLGESLEEGGTHWLLGMDMVVKFKKDLIVIILE